MWILNDFVKTFRVKGELRAHANKTILSVVLLIFSMLPAHADIKLIFGTYAADKPTETVRKYKDWLHYLEKELTNSLGEPVKIQMKIAKKYQAGIDQLVSGDVDFARFGPASYVMAHALNDQLEILAIESKKGKKRFKGVIAVHTDSQLQNLSDLANHSFAFGDQLSTIGRYLSQSLLIDAGVTSENLTSFKYLGRHDRVGSAVGAKKFTAGALKESTFEKLVASGTPIRVLTKFDNVTKPWLARSGLDPKILNAMRVAMLNATDAEVLKSISKDGFLEGSDSDYEIIRTAIKHSKSF